VSPAVNKLLLSKRAAAKLLGVGRGNTLASLIARGVLTPVVIDGREYISREALEALARGGEHAAPARLRRAARPPTSGRIADLVI
jgi:hypothetical protein